MNDKQKANANYTLLNSLLLQNRLIASAVYFMAFSPAADLKTHMTHKQKTRFLAKWKERAKGIEFGVMNDPLIKHSPRCFTAHPCSDCITVAKHVQQCAESAALYL